MGFAALAAAGIHDAEALFRTAAPARAAAIVPEEPVLLPGVYVTAEPVGDAPYAGTLCTDWRHVAGALAPPCPCCRPGQA